MQSHKKLDCNIEQLNIDGGKILSEESDNSKKDDKPGQFKKQPN